MNAAAGDREGVAHRDPAERVADLALVPLDVEVHAGAVLLVAVTGAVVVDDQEGVAEGVAVRPPGRARAPSRFLGRRALVRPELAARAALIPGRQELILVETREVPADG